MNPSLIFAKGRSALEAMAVGAAVVLCDVLGIGQMVTTSNFEQLRAINFGRRALRAPVTADAVAHELAKYDPRDALEVSHRVRATAGRDAAVDEIIALYKEVIAEHKAAGGRDTEDEGRAAASYLRQLHADMLTHGAASLRLRNRLLRAPGLSSAIVPLLRIATGQPSRLLRIPLLGKSMRALAWMISGKPSQ